MSPLYKIPASGGTLPPRVRDGDPHGRRLRHGGSVALGGFAALVQYSPARRTYFVRNDRAAGTRPVPETLYYEDCGSETCTPQYAGNVSRMAHSLAHGNAGYGELRDVTYAYDLMNRLTDVDDANIDSFDEVFAYDPQGRITSQRRGTNVASTSGGEYSYYAQSNKLKKVSAGMSDAVDAERLMNADSNFVYDADGNMTYDASKKMTVSYDYRGLPTEFRKAEANGDSTRLVMAYDGSGSRIMKRRDRKTAGGTEWITELTTHYTGIGSEIRESGLDGTAKVVVNLPQGLGRYGVENATAASTATPGFEWYLKNHLGSTMLVYGTGFGSGSVRAAYDYRAFGEQVNLTVPADKVTENFTGKELDDETDLGYWGARYLDQMLGLWVSADNARQHYSPYTYGSNNPIVRVDLDGNADVLGVASTGVHTVGGVSLIGLGASICTSLVGCAAGVPLVGIGAADLLTIPFNITRNAKDQNWPSEALVERMPAGAQDAVGLAKKIGMAKSVANKDAISVGTDLLGDVVDHLINAEFAKPLLPTEGIAPSDKTSVFDPTKR